MLSCLISLIKLY